MAEQEKNLLKKSERSSEPTQETRKRGRQGSIRQTHQLGKDGQRATNKQAIRSASILHRRKTTTSDKEAIEAIADHIENIYKEPDRPIDIPPWNQNHGIEIGSLEKAVGLAVLSAKKGKATDISGLSNACISSLREGTISHIAKAIRKHGENQEGFPTQWKIPGTPSPQKKRG